MELGAFSISLAVKDLQTSKSFYEQLGFHVFDGDAGQNWVMMKNGDHVIGLFQDMFDKNILTFNPGWDQDAHKLESFTDVRELQRALKASGVTIVQEADESSSGPVHSLIPDGWNDPDRPDAATLSGLPLRLWPYGILCGKT